MYCYRDDDINYLTCSDELKRIHEPFRKYNKIHTVACEMYQLWENKSLFYFLVSDPLINVELHGWRHEPYYNWTIENIYEDFKRSIEYWDSHTKRLLGIKELTPLKTISTWMATWNRSSDNCKTACDKLGLKVNTGENCTWQFHYWSTIPREVEEKLQ